MGATSMPFRLRRAAAPPSGRPVRPGRRGGRAPGARPGDAVLRGGSARTGDAATRAFARQAGFDGRLRHGRADNEDEQIVHLHYRL